MGWHSIVSFCHQSSGSKGCVCFLWLSTDDGLWNPIPVLLRLNADASLDAFRDSNAVVATVTTAAGSLALLPDGRILAAGGGYPRTLLLMRVWQDGSFDTGGVQALGWDAEWQAPAEHRHDWLAEALQIARDLGL